MAILIDGYNLLNVAGIDGRGRGTALAQARLGLLTFLASVLTEAEAARTTIVFDSNDAPPGLPREEQFGPIRVLFAKGYRDADELIEELIQADNSPRQLLVVSGDHRLHRAARRRRASAIDSDAWLSELRRRGPAVPGADVNKPGVAQTQSAHWVAEFSSIDMEQIHSELQSESEPATTPSPPAADSGPLKSHSSSAGKPRSKRGNPSPAKDGVDDELLRAAKDIFPPEFFAEAPERGGPEALNPFPPGYGEDVKDEED